VVNNIAPRDRDVAMVFQNYALYPHKTVFQNMAFGLMLRKAPKATIDERVRRSAEILGLGDMLDRYPRQLSGGQRQRVAMGRAIVRDPVLFLFDEPLSNLDAKLRVHMRTEIRALHQELRTTSIYVTHDQVEAMTMADRIVVLEAGRVAQMGAPLELYDRPANLFVAGFIGSPGMNLIAGKLRREGRDVAVEINGAKLSAPPTANGREGDSVVFGIRPEHLALTAEPTAVTAPVKVVQQTGIDSLVFADFAGVELCALSRDRHSLEPGQSIHFKPQLDAIHLFDAITGVRLAA
jgi:multiple sugar transport system ATP-binding protein